MNTFTYQNNNPNGLIEKFKDTFDHLKENVLITNPVGIIVYTNEAMQKTVGFSLWEMLGKRPKDIWGGHEKPEFYQEMWQTIKNKKPFSGRVHNKRKDGSFYTGELRIYPVSDGQGNILYFVGMIHDVTEVEKIEKKKDEFISFASHQLKNPITTSKIILHLLANEKNLTQTQRELIKEAEQVDDDLTDIIENLLILSRTKNGLEKSVEIDLPQLIKEIITSLDMSAKKKDLRFILRFTKDFVVKAPQSLIRHVLENIIANAVEYSFSGGEIFISISSKADEIIFSCHNYGQGIPKNEQSKIFNPFFRASNVINLKTGTGLGLYIAKSFIEEIGGRIWFSSEENLGTTFYVVIPEKLK